jgi:serine/threonine protein kinase
MILCRGLVYLHSRKIVWFDCKPSNVLLDYTGTLAKIADVGLCKMLGGTHTETVLVHAFCLITDVIPSDLLLKHRTESLRTQAPKYCHEIQQRCLQCQPG